MSNRYSVRGMGVSGGAFATLGDAEVAMVPSLMGYGLIEVNLVASLHDAQPEKFSSLDEPHWLFSFHDIFFASEILSIGLTPTGKIALASPGSPVRLTSAGTIVPDGTKRTIQLLFDGGGPNNTLRLDGKDQVFDGLWGGVGFATPGTVGRISVLNGINVLSKFHAAIHSLDTTWFPSAGPVATVSWAFSEGTGDDVAATTAGGDMMDAFDLTLRRMWLEYADPWGGDHSGDSGETISWVLRTPWRRRTRAATKFRKRRVSWLS